MSSTRCRYTLVCRMVSHSPPDTPSDISVPFLLTMPTGFAVVGDYEDENIKLAQVTAFEQMLNWLKEH